MILYHWTARQNVRSILKHGLETARALGTKKVVWHCRASKVAWALSHVAARHGIDPADLVLLAVETSRPRIRRTTWRAVYYSPTDYPPSVITEVGSMAQIVRGMTGRPGG